MALFSLSFITADLHAQNQIKEALATVKDGKATLLGQKNKLMLNWSSNLKKESNIDVKFSDIEIVKVEKQYILVGTSSNYVSKIVLTENNGNLVIAAGTVTCTTRGCATRPGCEPLRTRCSPCPLDCLATVTSGLAIKGIGN